jgi:hypothetical protein
MDKLSRKTLDTRDSGHAPSPPLFPVAQQIHVEQLCHAGEITKLTSLSGLISERNKDFGHMPSEREITHPLHSAVTEACGPLQEAKALIWVSGPQGSGKTTIGQRAARYGFMTMDCEDSWLPKFASDVPKVDGRTDGTHTYKHLDVQGRLLALTNATNWALKFAHSAMVFPACYPTFLADAPLHTLRVLLLPGPAVYDARWRARNPNDTQNHDHWYNKSVSLWAHDRGNSIIRVADKHVSCPDSSLLEMCNGIVRFLQLHPEELCFYCSRATETSSFHTRYCQHTRNCQLT